jgi:two-component system, OmpR family, phosphate regulon sensor histidine kinase PhoR
MNKKIITGLIALMGISILAIIIIQLVWMNNAIRVRNELFDRSVNEALNSTTNRIETLQDFGMINHFASDDTTFRDSMPMHFRPPMPPDFYRNAPRRPTPPKRQPEQQIKRIIKSGGGKNGTHYQISTRYDSLQSGKVKVIDVNTDSIARNLHAVYAYGISKFDSLVERFDYRKDTTGKLRRQFEFRTRNLRRVADKALQEIYAWEDDVPIERVNEVLTKELGNRNIPIPFEIGIFKNLLISAKTLKADSVLLAQSNYKVNMFPNNIFQKNVQLTVYFPDKETFIYKTLTWLLLISLIFSIVILVTFAVGIYFILKQKKISEMKSDFINNMTHEFKTPLATISVAADSISNQKVIENPERVRYFIEMIKKENVRMNRQVEDILTIARLDKKEFEFNWEAFNLHEVIENAMQSIVLQVEKKGGTITSELLAANPVATSDANHFANLIYNLLDNANKYSLNAPEIKISTRNTGKGILIKVDDKGIGMTKAVQSRVFERFYRQTSGNIHNVKGFGLGLSYVKAVLEANHGNISVHSEPGKGSSFEIFIPFIRES